MISKIPLNNISIKKLLQEEDFAIVPFVFNSSMHFESSSRYVESRLLDNKLLVEKRKQKSNIENYNLSVHKFNKH